MLGVKVPHRVNNCENCQNHKMCRSCIIGPKLNCFECEISKSCDKCLKRISQCKLYSTEITKKRHAPDESGYILPHYVAEDIVKEKRDQTQVRYGKCNKCFVEMNHGNYIKNRKRCGGCFYQNRRKQF